MKKVYIKRNPVTLLKHMKTNKQTNNVTEIQDRRKLILINIRKIYVIPINIK